MYENVGNKGDHSLNSDMLSSYNEHLRLNTLQQSLCDETCFLATFLFGFGCVLLLKNYLSSLHLI